VSTMSLSWANAGIAKAAAAVIARKVLRIMWCHSRLIGVP
jgi:hypothetical protein